MKRSIVIAIIIIVLGLIVFAGVCFATGFDFAKIGNASYETKTYPVTGEFTDISIDTDVEDIVFEPSADGSASVVCMEREKVKYNVCVENGTLKVEQHDERKWFDRLTLFTPSMKLTVIIPAGQYGALAIDTDTGEVSVGPEYSFTSAGIETDTGNVSFSASVSAGLGVKTDTGDITLQGIEAGSITLSVSTGDIKLSSVTCAGDISVTVSTGRTLLTDVICANLVTTGSTGDITLNNTIASGNFDIKRDTGDVKFEGCDAAGMTVNTSTGDVKGSLRTEKVFITESSTGRIDVPKTTSGGVCSITTSTGDIKIEIAGN